MDGLGGGEEVGGEGVGGEGVGDKKEVGNDSWR